MLVGVLISIMISIVVGVSLVPSIISSITEAKNTSGMPTGLSGLLDVLSYVFVAVILLGAVALGVYPISALTEQSVLQTGRIRGNLNRLFAAWQSRAKWRVLSPKCVETMGSAPYWGDEIVRALWKHEGNLGSAVRARGV